MKENANIFGLTGLTHVLPRSSCSMALPRPLHLVDGVNTTVSYFHLLEVVDDKPFLQYIATLEERLVELRLKAPCYQIKKFVMNICDGHTFLKV